MTVTFGGLRAVDARRLHCRGRASSSVSSDRTARARRRSSTASPASSPTTRQHQVRRPRDLGRRRRTGAPGAASGAPGSRSSCSRTSRIEENLQVAARAPVGRRLPRRPRRAPTRRATRERRLRARRARHPRPREAHADRDQPGATQARRASARALAAAPAARVHGRARGRSRHRRSRRSSGSGCAQIIDAGIDDLPRRPRHGPRAQRVRLHLRDRVRREDRRGHARRDQAQPARDRGVPRLVGRAARTRPAHRKRRNR